jgi:hypothetical protein
VAIDAALFFRWSLEALFWRGATCARAGETGEALSSLSYRFRALRKTDLAVNPGDLEPPAFQGNAESAGGARYPLRVRDPRSTENFGAVELHRSSCLGVHPSIPTLHPGLGELLAGSRI